MLGVFQSCRTLNIFESTGDAMAGVHFLPQDCIPCTSQSWEVMGNVISCEMEVEMSPQFSSLAQLVGIFAVVRQKE